MNLFITGTDTGVGKTYVTSLLARALLARAETVIALKPICCGDRDDAHQLLHATPDSGLTLDQINPCWLKTPAAPLAAALIENSPVPLESLTEQIRSRVDQSDHLLVEGAGGWEVPITETESMASLAATLGFPVLIVVDNKLGALNHTILTARQVQAAGLTVAGLILNHPREERDAASISNRVVLEKTLEVPILGELLYDADEMDLEGWPGLFPA